jgi:hypothetical protein
VSRKVREVIYDLDSSIVAHAPHDIGLLTANLEEHTRDMPYNMSQNIRRQHSRAL